MIDLRPRKPFAVSNLNYVSPSTQQTGEVSFRKQRKEQRVMGNWRVRTTAREGVSALTLARSKCYLIQWGLRNLSAGESGRIVKLIIYP